MLGNADEEMGAVEFRERVDCGEYFGRKTAIGLLGCLPRDGHLKGGLARLPLRRRIGKEASPVSRAQCGHIESLHRVRLCRGLTDRA